MVDRHSRRKYLRGLSAASVAALGGCLRLTETDADPTTDGSDEDSTATAATAGEADTRTGSRSAADDAETTAAPDVSKAWTLSKWGSDIATHDGTFYVSTWVSKQVFALAPDGTTLWKTDSVGKYKKNSLTVDDDVVVACGYGGQVTAFDRATGDVVWDGTPGAYATWTAAPLLTDDYVVGVNMVDDTSQGRDTVVYVLERDSGDVVTQFEYDGDELSTRISSLVEIDGRLVVSTGNYVDVYDLESLSRSGSYDQGLFGSNYEYEGDLLVATDDNVYRYALGDEELAEVWGSSLRGAVDDMVLYDEGIVANGRGGVFNLRYDGTKRWWGQTDDWAVRATVAGDRVAVMDGLLQLYVFDLATGDQVAKVPLPSEGSASPVGSVGSVVLTAVNPFTAYDLG